MMKEYKVKDFTKIAVTMLLTDEKTEVEAEATFDSVADALRVLSGKEKIESVSLDAETPEGTTRFNFVSEEKDRIKPVEEKPIRKAEIVEINDKKDGDNETK